jgi:hypothetical protein
MFRLPPKFHRSSCLGTERVIEKVIAIMKIRTSNDNTEESLPDT